MPVNGNNNNKKNNEPGTSGAGQQKNPIESAEEGHAHQAEKQSSKKRE